MGLFETVQAVLDARKDIVFVSQNSPHLGVPDFRHDRVSIEQATYVIAPKTGIYDVGQLNDFLHTLTGEIPEATSRDFLTRTIETFPAIQKTDIGVINCLEKVGTHRVTTTLTLFDDVLKERCAQLSYTWGLTPGSKSVVTPLHRGIHIMVYPDAQWAKQQQQIHGHEKYILVGDLRRTG